MRGSRGATSLNSELTVELGHGVDGEFRSAANWGKSRDQDESRLSPENPSRADSVQRMDGVASGASREHSRGCPMPLACLWLPDCVHHRYLIQAPGGKCV
jgi:hypothetical protein